MYKKLNSDLYRIAKTKKALIWDFDGVICFLNWDYGEDVDEWWNKFGDLYREFEKDVPFKAFEDCAYPDENMDLLISRYGLPAEERINKFFLKKETLILPHSPANSEIVEIISTLDPKIENFIWSNNQRETIEKFLKENGLGNKFKAIISRGKSGYKSKPDAKAFEEIMQITDTAVDDFMFIGDSTKTDKIVAQKLGMDFFHYK